MNKNGAVFPGKGAAVMKDRTYLAIDLKSFYASVECIERGLDPDKPRNLAKSVTVE